MEIVCNEWLFLDCMQNTVTKLPIFDFQFLNAYNLIESLQLIYIFIDSTDVWMCSGYMKKNTFEIARMNLQATVLDARASRVKWPAQFMSHWYGILFTE